jgi:molybdopterin converting factor small subunit
MSIQVRFFGPLTDVVGRSQVEVVDVKDTGSLRDKMLKDFPLLANYQFVIAVSKQIVRENKVLNSGDVVALLPPFSGG